MRTFFIAIAVFAISSGGAHAQKAEIAKKTLSWAWRAFGGAGEVAGKKALPSASGGIVKGATVKSLSAAHAVDGAAARAAQEARASAEAKQASGGLTETQESALEIAENAGEVGYKKYNSYSDQKRREEEKKKLTQGKTEYYGK